MFRSWQEPPFRSAGRAGRDDRDAFGAQHSEITVIVPFISPDGSKASVLRRDNESGEKEPFPHIRKVDPVLNEIRLPLRFIPYDDHGFL